jgi:chaperonin GroEL (HSP60 family)
MTGFVGASSLLMDAVKLKRLRDMARIKARIAAGAEREPTKDELRRMLHDAVVNTGRAAWPPAETV